MNRVPSFLAGLAMAVACLAFAPPREAAAQGAAVAAPAKCVDCFFSDATRTTYKCDSSVSGGTSCTLSNGGLSCSISGLCGQTAQPVPIDGAANFTTASLLENAGAEESFARMASAGEGRQQYLARCNGVVLARAYSVAMIDQLRSQTSVITL